MEDPSKEVIVFYHAQFCRICKGFSETWQNFADAMHIIDDLVVGHMDGAANEVKGLTFKNHGSFACVRLYSK